MAKVAKKNRLVFANSEKARDRITAEQKREIANLYEDWADDIAKMAKSYRNTSSDGLVKERYANTLRKSLTQQSRQVANELYRGIRQNIYLVADEVVRDNAKWLQDIGFTDGGIDAAFSSVPDSTVRMLVTGQIYDGGWNLSSRIWGDNEKTLKDCYKIVAKGLAENLPIYDIAKELEQYVRPSASKPWNPALIMENTRTGQYEFARLYKKKVDYNAQRLARTLVQHGYQQSFIAVTEKNPFVLRYQWLANGSRVCPICRGRDGRTYEKGELPMDHPNGMCTMIPVIADNLVDRIAAWHNSPDGTYPEIDRFARELGYTG